MRKFWIENGTGAQYALNGEQNIWFTEPKGLGVTFQTRFATIADGFWRTTQNTTRQNSVAGNITFLKEVYKSYWEFSNWLMTSDQLFLIYQPDTEQYRVRIEVSFLTKSEINRGAWLQVPVSFTMLTPWYKPSPLAFTAAPIPENVMVYPWVYDDAVYGSIGGNMTVVVPPDGQLPATWELTYTGPLTRPTVLITGQGTRQVYGRVVIDATLEDGDTLQISTRYLDSYIKSALRGDLVPYVDLAYDPYPRLPLNEPVVISLTAQDEIDGDLLLTVNNYYRTV